MDNKDIVNLLSTLLETSRDGEFGFQWSAEHATTDSLKLVFLTRAKDCALAASELQCMLRVRGWAATSVNGTADTPHRGWVSSQCDLAGHPDQCLLEDAQRGEDVALSRYREVLQDERLPPELRSVLEIQFEGARRNQNQIRELCNQVREMNH